MYNTRDQILSSVELLFGCSHYVTRMYGLGMSLAPKEGSDVHDV
jgi:hypothetical protein